MPADAHGGRADEDVVSYYSVYYRAGMTDLSSAAAPARHCLPPPRAIATEDLCFVAPTGCAALRRAIARRYESAAPAWPPCLPRAASEAKVRAAGHFLLPNRLSNPDDASYRVSLFADPSALRRALALLD